MLVKACRKSDAAKLVKNRIFIGGVIRSLVLTAITDDNYSANFTFCYMRFGFAGPYSPETSNFNVAFRNMLVSENERGRS